MDNTLVNNRDDFFGACNSFHGFKSFFGEIFKRKDFTRIYVIKGGPGTGKSSFMKKILHRLPEGCRAECILCSSDPHSIDGIILEGKVGRAALLDGTAPHIEEAIYPGAIDEIIDLGKCWENSRLIASKEKILSKSDEKKAAYSAAYSYMSIAGECNAFTERELISRYNTDKSKGLAIKTAEKISKNRDGVRSVRLQSAFCKQGIFRVDTLMKKAKHRIRLNGDELLAGLFLDDLIISFNMLGASYMKIPSPLSPKRCEAIYLPEEEILIGDSASEEMIDLCGLTNKDRVSEERTNAARELYVSSLEEAKRWFKIASELHFGLEEIYTFAMDFKAVDAVFEEKFDEIKKIVGL